MAKILIVDDEPSIRKSLTEILGNHNYETDTAESGKVCIEKATKRKYDLILLDIKMRGMDGKETFNVLSQKFPDIPVIMISGHGNIADAVDYVRDGAFDYIPKPPDLNRLLITIRNAVEKRTLTKEVKIYRRKRIKTAPQIIGNSEKIQRLKAKLKKVAKADSRILITGPNGVGKELAALNIHLQSSRKEGSFIEVNCAAIPSELIESVLFGHEKGSFTGAYKSSKGKFEQANGGTLFLDEVGDMSLAAQAKVLRALQENKITKVGGEKNISVDVRVIAATNKDLETMISGKQFREDLFYRLNVVPVEVPSLNERKEDIPALVEHFIQLICKEQNKPIKQFSPAAMQTLVEYNYKGNIRELKNIVERLLILGEEEITKQDVVEHVMPKLGQTKHIVKRLVHSLGGPSEAISFINDEFGKE